MSQNGTIVILRTNTPFGHEYRVKHMDSDYIYSAYQEDPCAIRDDPALIAKARNDFRDAPVFADEALADEHASKMSNYYEENLCPVEYGETWLEIDEQF